MLKTLKEGNSDWVEGKSLRNKLKTTLTTMGHDIEVIERSKSRETSDEEEEQGVNRTIAPLLRTAHMMAVWRGCVMYVGARGNKGGSSVEFWTTKAFGVIPAADLECEAVVVEPVAGAEEIWRELTNREVAGESLKISDAKSEAEAQNLREDTKGQDGVSDRAAVALEKEMRRQERRAASQETKNLADSEGDDIVVPGGELPTQVAGGNGRRRVSLIVPTDIPKELSGEEAARLLRFDYGKWQAWNSHPDGGKILTEEYWAERNVEGFAVVVRFCWDKWTGPDRESEPWVLVAEHVEDAGAAALIFLLPEEWKYVPEAVMRSDMRARDVEMPVLFVPHLVGRHMAIRSAVARQPVIMGFAKSGRIDYQEAMSWEAPQF